MMDAVITLCYAGLIAAVLLGLYRLGRGPGVMDRILAFDTITTCAVGMVILLSIQWRSPYYLELVLAFSLLGFFSTVAFTHHLQRTHERDEETAEPRKPPPAHKEEPP